MWSDVRPLSPGALLMSIAVLAGLILCVVCFFVSPGIGHTTGVIGVIGFLVLSLLAALALAFTRAPRLVRGVLDLFLLIVLVGLVFAGWFLDLWLLMAFMTVALVGWVWHIISGLRALRRVPCTIPAGEPA